MKLTVDRKNYGIRIDKFLKEGVFFNDKITRGEIIRQIKNGNVLVNSKKIKPSYILKENDIIETKIKEQRTGNNVISNKNIKLEIIFQDENIIVVNKPARMQVHPDYHEKNNTLANGLVAKFPEIKNVGDPSTIRQAHGGERSRTTSSGQAPAALRQAQSRPGIVHRLDKDTSGVIVIARNQKTFLELKNKFKNREIEKKYLAVVYGKPKNKTGIINKPLARATTYKKQVIAGKKTETKVREAITYYKVLKTWDNFSLLEITPKTGRMHQIRVHLTSIGHPIVGDKIYKVKNIETQDAPRQMLHAKSIKFKLGDKECFFEANIPADFDKFLNL